MKKLLFLIFLSVCLLCSCKQKAEQTPSPQPQAEEEAVIIFDKHNETISPDGKYVLYNYSISETSQYGVLGLMISVDDTSGKNLHSITLDAPNSNDILGVEWIGNSYFGVTTHVNPSTSEYLVFSMETGEEIARYSGYSFSVLPMEQPTVIYAENVPHGYGAETNHSYAINSNTVYVSTELGGVLSKVAFSEDMTLAVFTESFIYDFDEQRPSRLVMGYYDGALIQVINTADLPEGISGDPTVDENNNIIINGYRLTDDNTFEKM